MALFRTVLLFGVVACFSLSTTTALQPTAPASSQLYSKNYQEIVHKRLLRAQQSIEEANEERVSVMDAFKSTNIQFKVGRLGDSAEAALGNAKKMNKLWKRVDEFNMNKAAAEQISLTSSLVQKYGDDAVLAGIQKAYLIDDTKTAATKFGSELLLNHAAIFKGTKYRNTDFGELLTKKFGENMVLNFIATAKKASSSSSKTTELKKLESTMLVQKMDIFAGKLGMQDDLVSILNSRDLGKLDDYITDVTRRFPENDVSFLRILTSKYNDEKVAKALVGAQTTGHSKELAKNLQQEQFAAWMKEGMSMDNAFQLLRLERLEESVVNSRALESLKGYIAFLSDGRQNTGALLDVLSKGFGGEFKLAAIFTNAKATGDRLGEGTEASAEALQKMVFQYWFRGGVDSKEKLYRKFNLDEATAEFYQKRVVDQFGEFLPKKKQATSGVAFVEPRRR